MNKNLILILSLIAVLGGFFLFRSHNSLPQDFKEVTFSISGNPIALKNGVGTVWSTLTLGEETEIKYFGNELAQDVDRDDVEDIVFLVTQKISETETYFYLVGSLKRAGGYIGSQAVMLGKNISPQNTGKGTDGMVIVNYTERFPGQEADTGKSLWLRLDPETLEFGEVVQNFEGETR